MIFRNSTLKEGKVGREFKFLFNIKNDNKIHKYNVNTVYNKFKKIILVHLKRSKKCKIEYDR